MELKFESTFAKFGLFSSFFSRPAVTPILKSRDLFESTIVEHLALWLTTLRITTLQIMTLQITTIQITTIQNDLNLKLFDHSLIFNETTPQI